MFTCSVCHFTVELDDVTLPTESGHCVCLGCYLRATGQPTVMPKELRRELTTALDVEPKPAAPFLRMRNREHGN
jgi:hypothetical protein